MIWQIMVILDATEKALREVLKIKPGCGGCPVWYCTRTTANLRTKILDFTGFGSSRILVLRGGILMSIGSFPEILSQSNLSSREFTKGGLVKGGLAMII